MRCSKCGTVVKVGSFCPECGTRIDWSVSNSNTDSDRNSNSNYESIEDSFENDSQNDLVGEESSGRYPNKSTMPNQEISFYREGRSEKQRLQRNNYTKKRQAQKNRAIILIVGILILGVILTVVIKSLSSRKEKEKKTVTDNAQLTVAETNNPETKDSISDLKPAICALGRQSDPVVH